MVKAICLPMQETRIQSLVQEERSVPGARRAFGPWCKKSVQSLVQEKRSVPRARRAFSPSCKILFCDFASFFILALSPATCSLAWKVWTYLFLDLRISINTISWSTLKVEYTCHRATRPGGHNHRASALEPARLELILHHRRSCHSAQPSHHN